ncbi:MAG: [acyl-carrier-protein] S-malonyltransferase [Omnitrophica bacterium GWA2_52_12]|nr:MAG: [acyl-carrier-protein] S-malonyltransferase [Omnitrophica bacterium GWA2_52_12]
MTKIGFLFPGQGAQFVGMGRDLYEQVPQAKAVYDRADAVLGYALSKICFEGPEDELTRTLNAQPAIYVTSLAALAALRARIPDIQPVFAAGLSLGEWSALAALNALDWEEGLRLVQIRAQAMEKSAQARPGTMASVLGLPASDCDLAAREAGCEVANLNSPDQTVLSGTVESIQKLIGVAEGMGAKKVFPLKVGGAFHSSLMSEARGILSQALQRVQIKSPSAVFIPNAAARPVSDTEEIRNLLAAQVTSPVRWVETMNAAAGSGAGLFLEIGPGKVLKGLARKCVAGLAVEPCGTVEDIDKAAGLLSVQNVKK